MVDKINGVPCTMCGSNMTYVKDSRATEDGIKRTRQCRECDTRFITYELTEEDWRRKAAMIERGLAEMRAWLQNFEERAGDMVPSPIRTRSRKKGD